MTRFQDAWLTHQQQRFMRPDAARYVRQDALRWMPPGTRELGVSERKYSPDQPRVPAGSAEGGQWTSGSETPSPAISIPDVVDEVLDEALAEAIRDLFERDQYAQYNASIFDADGSPYYKPGGHHEMTRETFGKWNLQPETRQIFEQSTTGKLPQILLRATPDGAPISNSWNSAHRAYNLAVGELSEQFLQRNNIRPEQMTPVQAQSLLKEIRESTDPRIRDFNSSLRFLRRILPLRTGRGSD